MIKENLLGNQRYPRTQLDMQMYGRGLDLSTTAFHKKLESALNFIKLFWLSFITWLLQAIKLLQTNILVSTVVENSTHNPKVKGLNPATGRMA